MELCPQPDSDTHMHNRALRSLTRIRCGHGWWQETQVGTESRNSAAGVERLDVGGVDLDRNRAHDQVN